MAEMNLEQRQYLTARFEEFVAVVHPSGDDQPVRKPYQWQIRLMLYVAGHGHWPQGIGAPTASGKTCVIALLQKTILSLLFWIVKVMLSFEAVFEEG